MTHRAPLICRVGGALLAMAMAWPAFGQTASSPGFFADRERGWFWYEIEPEPEPEQSPAPKPQPAPAAPTPAQTPVAPTAQAKTPEPEPPFGSSEWLRVNLPKYKDRAIDDPTPENLRAYMTIQRLTMDKASAFTDQWQRVVMGDPLLDEVGRRPTGTAFANEMNRVAGEATDEQLKAIAETAGIWFFYRSDCVYCDQQAPVLQVLERLYGFKIMAIALDGAALPNGLFPNFKADEGQAAQLGVERTPTMFLVRPPDGFVAISQGALSLQELKRRILTGAVTAKWIDEEAFDRTRPVNRGPMLPPKPEPPPAAATPADVVKYLRAQVRKP